MIGGRSFATALKNGVGSFKLRQNLTKSGLASNVRLLSTLKPYKFGSSEQPKMAEMNLISKRFLSENSSKVAGWKFPTNLVATAVGAVIGYAGVKAWKDESFLSKFQVSCADKCEIPCGPKSGGGGGEKGCVEKKCEDSPCLRKMDCEEELIMRANADLEKALKEIKSKAIEYTEAAMKAYCAAIAIMKEYMNQGYCIIDNDDLETPEYEEAWCCLYKIAKERCEKVKDALQKGQCAWELLCRLRETIESGKNCKYTSCNPLLVTAEEALTCAERELLNLKARMDCVSSDHDMVEQYRQVIEDFRKDLKADVDAVVESGQCNIQFAEQEQALMIMMAYRRAVKAHKEVAQVMVCTGNLPDRLAETLC